MEKEKLQLTLSMIFQTVTHAGSIPHILSLHHLEPLAPELAMAVRGEYTHGMFKRQPQALAPELTTAGHTRD